MWISNSSSECLLTFTFDSNISTKLLVDEGTSVPSYCCTTWVESSLLLRSILSGDSFQAFILGIDRSEEPL